MAHPTVPLPIWLSQRHLSTGSAGCRLGRSPSPQRRTRPQYASLGPEKCPHPLLLGSSGGNTDINRLRKLSEGVSISDHQTLPCRAWLLEPQPQLPPRDPPIRVRKTIPDCWIALELTEGKNRQVRKMTAAVGHPHPPVASCPDWQLQLGNLPPSQWKELTPSERNQVFLK